MMSIRESAAQKGNNKTKVNPAQQLQVYTWYVEAMFRELAIDGCQAQEAMRPMLVLMRSLASSNPQLPLRDARR
jgi:hypothetical protein